MIQTEYSIRDRKFAVSAEAANIELEIKTAIAGVTWPPESKLFTINPVPKGNGVDPIKKNFLAHLASKGWLTEARMGFGAIRPGPLDAVKRLSDGRHFAVEWETGNISSSHRALNKMAMGMQSGELVGGALVLPTRNLYRYLTDRIGNFEEIAPYFPLFRTHTMSGGLLAVFAIQHDAESPTTPLIPKRTDGLRNFRA